jgi:hypothetical protein
MNSVATHPPELAELVDAGRPSIAGRRQGEPTSQIDALVEVPPLGRAVAQGTIFALLGVQLAWLAVLAVVVISIVR